MHPALNIAIKAARRAGKIINRAALDIERLEIRQKNTNDFVTEVDMAAEQAIISVLSEAYPTYGFLAEESGSTAGQVGREGSSDYVWIIDPLDGTTNFIHGLPQYAVSIALAKAGQVQQAVVFDPCKNELFTATRGGGAFLNDRRIRVSGRLRLEGALLGTGFPFRQNARLDRYLAIFGELAMQAAGIRRPGAAALDLAYVACGRYDGFWEFGLSPWDMAAGALLIQEAGGLVTDAEGQANYLQTGDLVAGVPKLFPALLACVQKHN